MRASFAALLAVALLAGLPATAIATSPAPTSGETRTSIFLDTWSRACAQKGVIETCDAKNLTIASVSQTTIDVCVHLETLVFNLKTSVGRVAQSEDGCSGPVDASRITIREVAGEMQTTLRPVSVALFTCGRKSCTETRVASVSASESGGPVEAWTASGTYGDGSCFTESRRSAPITGTVTVGRSTGADAGMVRLSELVIQPSC